LRRTHIAAGLVGAGVLLAGAIGIYLPVPRPEALSGGLPFAQIGRPKQVPDLQFQDGAGKPRSLTDFRGKLLLLNIWATWCTPCREEMPALDRLQAKIGAPGFEIVALSIDQRGPDAARKFFDEFGIKALKVYVDPSAQAAFKLGTVGLPTTLLIDRGGREIGRHVGPAKWDASETVENLRRMVDGPER